jgi:hypothetical protein
LRVSLCNPGCLKLKFLLLPPPECWNYRHTPLHLAHIDTWLSSLSSHLPVSECLWRLLGEVEIHIYFFTCILLQLQFSFKELMFLFLPLHSHPSAILLPVSPSILTFLSMPGYEFSH